MRGGPHIVISSLLKMQIWLWEKQHHILNTKIEHRHLLDYVASAPKGIDTKLEL